MDIPEKLKENIEKNIKIEDIAKIKNDASIISERYRSKEKTSIRVISDIEKATSYVLTRMPATYGAIYKSMYYTFEKYNSKDIISMIDIGAGTGAGEWAASEFLNLNKITAIEKEINMSNMGKRILNENLNKITTWKDFDIINDNIEENADLVLCSYMLNETSEKEKVILKMWKLTNQVLLLVEPGTPEGYKNIIKAKEILVKEGGYVIAPCPNNEKCKLMENNKKEDWCAFSVRIARSKAHKELKKAEVPYEDEKFIFLAVCKNEKEIKNTGIERILRHPKIEKGLIKIKTCSESEIKEEIVTKKDKDRFKIVKKSDAGDLIK